MSTLKSNEKTEITQYHFSYDIVDAIEDKVTKTLNFDIELKYFINFLSSMNGSEGKSTLFENNKDINIENTNIFILPEDTLIENNIINKETKLNALKESLDNMIKLCNDPPLVVIDENCTEQLSLFLNLILDKKSTENYDMYMNKIKVLIIGRALNIHKRKFALTNYCSLVKNGDLIVIKNIDIAYNQ